MSNFTPEEISILYDVSNDTTLYNIINLIEFRKFSCNWGRPFYKENVDKKVCWELTRFHSR